MSAYPWRKSDSYRLAVAEEATRRKHVAARSLSPILPEPFPLQSEFINSPASRKVMAVGRRGGKTSGLAILACMGLQRGRRIMYAAPTSEQTDRFWYACRHYYRDDIDGGRLRKTETNRLLEPPGVDENGPRIRAKTAWNADTLRGDWGDLILVDEYAIMSPDVDEVLLPMLLDRNGSIVWAGTPKRRNHFYAKLLQAKTDDSGRYAFWHFPSHANPYLDADALAEITADLSEDAYKQEILAEFLEGEGVVFRNLAACLNAPLAASYDSHPRHRIVAGVDWGKQNDYTAISIGCATCRVELARDRFNQIDYLFQYGRLQALIDRWRVGGVLVERNAVGIPAIEQLTRMNVPLMLGPDDEPGFNTLPSTKPPLIENLALAFERTEWQFQADPVWTAELEAYERKLSAVTGRSQYTAPEGLHDDTVIARALMVWAAGRAHALPNQPVAAGRWKSHEGQEQSSDGDESRWRRY